MNLFPIKYVSVIPKRENKGQLRQEAFEIRDNSP